MEKYLSEINYDQLVEKALKHVVIEALKIVERQGLPGDHHFYVAFRTDHPGVKMDDLLRSQYPKEMTIVLQNQFSDLAVNDNGFAVTLKFSRVPYRVGNSLCRRYLFRRSERALRCQLRQRNRQQHPAGGNQTDSQKRRRRFHRRLPEKGQCLKNPSLIAGRHNTSISIERNFMTTARRLPGTKHLA